MIEWFLGELARFMIYGAVGFVCGAVWCGLGKRNDLYDRKMREHGAMHERKTFRN